MGSMGRKRKLQRRGCGRVAALLAALLAVGISSLRAGDLKVTYVDVGVGDAIHIQTPAGKNYLIDGGDTSDPNTPPTLDDTTQDFCPLVKYLLDNNIRTLDFILKTHDDSDHYRGLQALLGTKTTSGGSNVFSVGAVVFSSDTAVLTNLSSHPETKSVRVSSGTRLETLPDLAGIWDPALTGLVLYPRSPTSDPSTNSGSVVVKFTYDRLSFLFTGDAETADETAIRADFSSATLASTVLKVAHHGSRTGSSSAFLDAVTPQVAVVSVAANSYGLPDAEILKRLTDKGAAVYRTDQQGHVSVVTNGSAFAVYTAYVSSQTVTDLRTVSSRPSVHVYPNPAPGKTSPAKTTVVYELNGVVDEVRVAVYSFNGELVRSFDGVTRHIGSNYFDWDLKNGEGEAVVNGLYYVQVEAKAGGSSLFGRTKMAVLRP